MTRRGIVIGLLVVLLGGGAVFASIKLLATEKVAYLDVSDSGPDPFTPPAVFTSDSPGPPAPIDPTVTITTPSNPDPIGDNPGPVGGTVKKGDCDQELLIQYLNSSPERRAAWLELMGLLVDDFEDYLRNTTPALLTRATRVTLYGFAEGSAVDQQSILAEGSSVLIADNGDIVIRCYNGSPLKNPRQIKYSCDGCPDDLPAPLPCNKTCYNVPAVTPSGTPSTTTSQVNGSSTTTTRVSGSSTTRGSTAASGTPTTRRRTTTTRTSPTVTASFFSTSPPTTFAPPATLPPTTAPPPTFQTAPTIPPQTFPPQTQPTTTTTRPTTTTCVDLLGLGCLLD